MQSIESLLSQHPGTLENLEAFIKRDPSRAATLLDLVSSVHDQMSENDRYRKVEALTYAIYPKFRFSEFGRIFLEDQEFIRYYERFMDPGNWHSLDRKYTLDQMFRLTIHLTGDVAECGVYKGATAYLLARRLLGTDKHLHLFDSFEGLSEPVALDGTYWRKGSLLADESSASEALRGFRNVSVHKGWIPSRFMDVQDKTFCFVHIDVDILEPTRDSIEFFYPRMMPGGIMLFDDYGFTSCPGAKLAADVFFEGRPEKIGLLTTGQAIIIKQ